MARAESVPAAASELADCRTLLADGSRTFLAASRVLPRRVRDPATALYAFCRIADDLVDGATASQLGPVLAGLGALEAYAARVAGSVGAMMAVLMGARGATALARACDLGVAMQYSNIARDVGEDARAGRLYLPLAWLREAGIDPAAFLAAPRFDPRLATVVARLLAEADRLYARAAAGIRELPVGCRFGIDVARRLYASIGHEVARRGGNSVDTRAVVSPLGKARLAVRSGVSAWWSAADDAPPLPSNRFLVEAAVEAGAGKPARIVWLLDLFERLERADRGRPGGIAVAIGR